MKAAILVKQREPLIVGDVKLPTDLEYGQVFVKVVYSGICGSQLGEIDGIKGEDAYLPHLLGHEGSGIVEKIGKGVTTVKVGDHVVLHWKPGKGVEAATPQYIWNGNPVNAGRITTFNEYAVVSENRVTAIPTGIDLKTAPLFGCAIPTAFGVIHNDANLKVGESIVVFGCGGVGIAIILAASLSSAYPIIAVDINDSKLEHAKKFGATHLINSSKMGVDVAREINSILPQGGDVVVDNTGITSVREQAYELTSNKGRTIFVGVPKLGEKISIDSFPLHFTKRITGSHGGDAKPDYDIPRLIRLQNYGAFSLEEMISHTYSLDKINEAIAMVRSGSAIRCVIKMENVGQTYNEHM